MEEKSLAILKRTAREKISEIVVSSCCLIGIAVTSFFQPTILKRLTDDGLLQKNRSILTISILLFIGSQLLRSLCSNIQTKKFGRIQIHAERNFLNAIIEKLERIEVMSYEKYSSYELLNSVKMDTKTITSIFGEFTSLVVAALLQMSAGIMGVCSISWKLSLLIIVVIPIKMCCVKFYACKQEKILEDLLASDNGFFIWLSECIEGLEICKFWKKKKGLFHELDYYSKPLFQSEYNAISNDCDNTLIIELTDMLVYGLLYGVGGYLSYRNQITVGALLAVVAFSSNITASVTLFMNMRYYYAKMHPSLKRMDEFLNEDEELNGEDGEMEDIHQSKMAVICQDVSFQYPNSKRMLLSNVSFQIRRGEKVALIGINGAGKSTLLKLMCGLYHPKKGTISLFEKNTCEIPGKDLREHISIVTQNPFLWKGTIQDNIDCNRIHFDDYILDLCRRLEILTDISDKDKLSYEIKTKGENLSVGERKKVALARASVKDAEIVILDEITAGMDSKISQKIVNEIFDEKTVIFTSHVATDLQYADRVFALQGDGTLTELYPPPVD